MLTGSALDASPDRPGQGFGRVLAKHLEGPLNEILDSLATWLSSRPELQVLHAIVIAYTVAVMHVLVGT